MNKQEHPKHAIVIVVDRLGSGFLGPYGNTWIDTPTLNQLASESILLETAIADSPELDQIYRSWWSGCHAMRREATGFTSLPALIAGAGLPTTLLSDATTVLEHPLAAAFDEQISLALPAPGLPAGEIEETRLAQVFITAAERLATAKSPGLFWIHARGMGGCWDSPLVLRDQFRDEEDPEPYASVAPPDRQIQGERDPDEILRVEHAYAGEIAVFDACLGMLLEVLDQHPCCDETLVIVTSPRGYPLGEHGTIGPISSALHAELLQTPLLIRPPSEDLASTRLQALAQPSDLYATLAAWFAVESTTRSIWQTDLLELASDTEADHKVCAFASGAGERAVRTPAWFMRQFQNERRVLYAKPDDRWEVNEVADRCGDIPDQLAALMDSFEISVNASELSPLPELSAKLLEGID